MNIYIKLDYDFEGNLNSDTVDSDNNVMTNVEALTIVWQYCTFGELSIAKRVLDAMNSLQITMDADDYDLLKQMYDATYTWATKSIETNAAVELSQQAYFFLTHKYNHLENEDLNNPNISDPSKIPLPNGTPASLEESFWQSNCNIEGQKQMLTDRINKRLYYKKGMYNKEIQDYNTKLLLQYNT